MKGLSVCFRLAVLLTLACSGGARVNPADGGGNGGGSDGSSESDGRAGSWGGDAVDGAAGDAGRPGDAAAVAPDGRAASEDGAAGRPDGVPLGRTDGGADGGAQAAKPEGIVAIVRYSDAMVSAAALGNPEVAGFLAHAVWADLEKTNDIIDAPAQAKLSAQLAQIKTAGKFAGLWFGGMGRGVPSWAKAGLPLFSWKYPVGSMNTVSFPPYWNPTYLGHKKDYISRMGATYDGDPTVRYVYVSCMNTNTDDWFMPAVVPDGTDYSSQWNSLGWNHATMLDACKQLVDETARSFPSKHLAMAIGQTGMDSDKNLLSFEVAEYCTSRYPGRCHIGKMSLSPSTPAAPPPISNNWWKVHDSIPNSMGQMLGAATAGAAVALCGGGNNPDQCMLGSISKGKAYSMSWIEIWSEDSTNPALQDELASFNKK